MNKKLAILMVVHNEKKNFEMLFNSLIYQNFRDFKIFIIDNNSSDGSVSFAKELNKKYSLEIEFIELLEETGYTGGNNIGAQKALEQGYEFLFIINNDIELERNCISELVSLIESKKNAAAVGPILFYWNADKRENLIQAYGVKVDFKKQTKIGLFSQSIYETVSPNEIEKIDMVPGAALMIRGDFVKKYGLFDPNFFIYNDEIDLAYRIKKAGLDSYVTEKAKVWHNHDWSKKNIIGYKFMYYYMMRNRILYFYKFKFYLQLLIDIFLQIVTFPVTLKMFLKIGSLSIVKYYYSGLFDGLLGKKGIANKRFDKSKKKKKIILTIDYELFLGDKTGTVRECMIEPTKKLASILEKNGSRMTIFWDILHYYRLLELENDNLKLKQRRLLIEKQILELATWGHDIQLHLHPHWLDAKYEKNNWDFNYERFKLHNLSDENNPQDINTILGCVTISKKLIEDLIRKVKPDYKVTTFRAGGYLIEPFGKLKNAFLKNEITIDSSICPELYNPDGISPYDFRFYPNKNKYNFDLTPKVITEEGKFVEIPVTTIKLHLLRNIFYKIVRKVKYSNLNLERRGAGVGESYGTDKNTFNFNEHTNRLLSSQITQLTTDSNFSEKFDYLYKKVPELSTMIIHPKLLNSHTLGMLNEYVSTNKIRFISIQDFLTNN